MTAARQPAPPPKVLGIDLSLTGTGLSDGTWCETIRTTGRRGDSYPLRLARIARITDAVMDHARHVELAVIEGPALRSVDGHVWDRAGLWWQVVRRLHAADVHVAVVPPTVRAKYATGNGSASKDSVLLAAARRWPAAAPENNNEADALILACMGLDWLGCPPVPMPKAHRVVLDRVAWPA